MAALAALALAPPLLALAKPVGDYSLVAAGDGDQTDPSIDSDHVVFASSVSGNWDVQSYLVADPPPPLVPVADGQGDEDQPDVFQATVIYRTADGVAIRGPGGLLQPRLCAREGSGGPAAVAHPVISARVAAWECGAGGSQDVAVARYGSTMFGEYLVGRDGPAPAGVSPAGDQFAPAAYGALVAFVDGGDGGSVWLHDSDPAGVTTRVCGGRATGVAVGYFSRPVVAVTRATGQADADVEIWDADGLVTALHVPGEQRNPHLSEDWVAFEDLTTGFSQVVLWRWSTSGTVFIPKPSASNQTLNDLSVLPLREVRVVLADDADGSGASRDIALYRLTFDPSGAVPDDGTDGWPWPPPPPPTRPPPASCDDPDPVVLGTLELARGVGRPLAGAIEFDAAPFPGDPALPVLVCIEGEGVSAAWVALDHLVLASPSDFHRKPVRLQVATVAEGGRAKLSGVIAGRRGGSLVARVLADPGRAPLACEGLPPRHDRDGDGEEDHEIAFHTDHHGDDDDDGDRDQDDGDDDHDGDRDHDDGDRDRDHDHDGNRDGDGDHDDGDHDHDGGDLDDDGGPPAWRPRCILPPGDDWRPPAPPRKGWCGTGGGAGSLAFLAVPLVLRLLGRRRSGPPAE